MGATLYVHLITVQRAFTQKKLARGIQENQPNLRSQHPSQLLTLST